MTKITVNIITRAKEIEIVKLLADGYNVREVSEKMKTNKRSLEAKLALMRGKYRTTTLAGLVAIFLRNKLIE